MPQLRAVNVQQGGKPRFARKPQKKVAGQTPGRPKGLTESIKRERDREIVRDRLVNDMSWASLALKYDMNARSCRRIVAAWQRTNAGNLREIDPEGEIWEQLQSYEAQIERMRDIRDDARAQKNLNAVLGAERQITTIREAKLGLMQEAGLLPMNLGTLRHVHETKVLVEKIMVVLTRIENGEVEATDAKRELLHLIESPLPN